MTAYRSTTLKLLQHCPRAIDYAEAGTPMDLDPFAAGIAAHAVIQAVGESVSAGHKQTSDHSAVIAQGVARELVTHGRSFEAIAEPPMSPEAARDGRNIALNWLATHQLSPAAEYEIGLAVDKDWKPVKYDSPAVYYRAILDVGELIEEVDDDGYRVQILCVEDHKSAWPTNADELDTIQLRGQALVALANAADTDIIRRRVNNLRTGAVYTVDTILDETGLAEIAQWRKDIDLLIDAADARQPDGKRPARPGAGCLGCPYLIHCDAAESVFNGIDRRETVERFAVADAFRAELFKLAKIATAESPIAIDGGFVGYREATENRPADDAARTLAHEWFGEHSPEWDAANAQLLGLLAAMNPGAGQFENVAKVLHKFDRADPTWKEDREAFLSRTLTPVKVAKFGVHKE